MVVVGSLLIVAPVVVSCNCSKFCWALICVYSSFAIILMGKRKMVALLCLSFWCLAIVVLLFLMVPGVCLQFVIAVFPDHNHLLLLKWWRLCLFSTFVAASLLISILISFPPDVFFYKLYIRVWLSCGAGSYLIVLHPYTLYMSCFYVLEYQILWSVCDCVQQIVRRLWLFAHARLSLCCFHCYY